MAMRRSLTQAVFAVCALATWPACRRHVAPPEPASRPPVSGTLIVDGVSATVRVVRDRWGIPHIYADRQDDLFFTQGFVQAQDRLFQMDLWRRSVQGRLAEVLGANFIERDVMTRRIQYRGGDEQDWASAGPDAKAIATAFVRGVNAWVAVARARPPEEFRLAGWLPDFWRPEDLLNRTDAFLSSGTAGSAVLRARLVAAVGIHRADLLLPSVSGTPTVVPHGLDPASISYVVGDALRMVGTQPFFMGLAANAPSPIRHPQSNAWAVAPSRSATGSPLLANDPHRAFEHPSLRYLVHLHGPGWNVIGATAPWLPGVAIGHNDRIAWGLTAFDADVQDLYVERTNPHDARQVEERGRWVDTEREPGTIAVKGRAKPIAFDIERTRHGVVVAVDGDRHLKYTVRWTGTEPGTASELGALALDRARSWSEFRIALGRWKMPAVDAVYADAEGNIGHQSAALVPIRRAWNGALPAPGWTGTFEWVGWRSLDALPHSLNPGSGYVAAANHSAAREGRLHDVLSTQSAFNVDDFKRLQHDTVAWNAQHTVPLIEHVTADRDDVEHARQQLVAWDRRVAADSPSAALYVFWEQALKERLVDGTLDGSLARDYLEAAERLDVAALARSAPAMLIDALAVALGRLRTKAGTKELPAWGALHAVLFRHPLAITDVMRRRFDVGPFPVAGYADTVMASEWRSGRVAGGASFRQIVDLADWDRSLATNTPGQSGSPDGPHFRDFAKVWTAGEYVLLPFSDHAVQASAETTLVLMPQDRANESSAPTPPSHASRRGR